MTKPVRNKQTKLINEYYALFDSFHKIKKLAPKKVYTDLEQIEKLLVNVFSEMGLL